MPVRLVEPRAGEYPSFFTVCRRRELDPAFLAPSGIIIPIALVALELYLAWHYRARFRPMLAAARMLFNRSAPHDRIVDRQPRRAPGEEGACCVLSSLLLR